MSKQFAFVPTNGLGKPRLAGRRLIRTHCMQGKNRRELPINSAKQLPGTSVLIPQPRHRPPRASTQRAETQSAETYGNDRPYSRPRPESEPGVDDATIALQKLPRPPPPDIELLPLAAEVDRHSQELLFRFRYFCRSLYDLSLIFHPVFTSQEHFPLKVCIDFDERPSDYSHWFFQDVAFLHSVLLAICAIHDNVRDQPLARVTRFHLQRTLHLLNRKLAEQDGCRTDSTVYIFITLALMAGLFGDHAAAEKHMTGLRQIVRLRGGLEQLRRTPKLHFTIGR